MKRVILLSLLISGLLFAKSADQVMVMPHTGNVPGWGKVDLTKNAAVTGESAGACYATGTTSGLSFGTLGIGNGGTGQTSFASGALSSNGSALTSGVLSIANGGTGISSAGSQGQFLRMGASLPAWGFPNIVSKTSAYTATASDDVILVSGSGGAFTVTLPTAVGITGKVYYLKRTDSTLANAVTLATTSSQTIDGATTVTLNTQYESITVISDGSNWQIIERKFPGNAIAFTPTISAGFGSVTNNNAWYRRVGDSIEMWGTFFTGTVAASAARIGLPSGLSINTSAIDRNAGQVVGSIVDGGTNTNGISTSTILFVATSQTATVSVGDVANGSNAQVLQETNGSAAFFNAQNVSYFAKVPISGWGG